MEFLVFILIILFVLANSGKGKNKKPGQARQKASPVREKAPSATVAGRRMADLMREWMEVPAGGEASATAPADPRPLLDVETAAAYEAAQGFSAVDEAGCAGGSLPHEHRESVEDEEGCVGGSMAHEHTEGETREEHRRHVESLRRREAEETRAAQTATALAEMNVRRLRQAVIMAEILDRPKALRRRFP